MATNFRRRQIFKGTTSSNFLFCNESTNYFAKVSYNFFLVYDALVMQIWCLEEFTEASKDIYDTLKSTSNDSSEKGITKAERIAGE